MRNALVLVALVIVACSGEPFGTPLFHELDGSIVDVQHPELDAGDGGDALELEAEAGEADALELDAGDGDVLVVNDAPELDAGDGETGPPDSGKPDSGKPDAGGGTLDCCGPSSCSNAAVHQCVCNFDINCCATWDSVCGTYVESQGCGECS